MNANEVIANRAIELAGGVLGSKDPNSSERSCESVAIFQRHLSHGHVYRGRRVVCIST